jgi:3-oxoacyl-[acyl-carrier-protein] synthase-1
MKPVLVASCNITSSLGSDAVTNFRNLLKGVTGVQQHQTVSVDDQPAWVSLTDDSVIDPGLKAYSRYEQLLIASIREAQTHTDANLSDPQTLFVFSTTKGNISILENETLLRDQTGQLELYESAKKVTAYFGNPNEPVIISNACISGVVALLYAKRMLDSGICNNAIVTGADTISRFVYSGFKSFQALSNGPCHPFSSQRDGINLGEAAATIILSSGVPAGNDEKVYVGEGSITNDSNHISGPSRTGQELATAIKVSLEKSGLTARDIDFISAHGTATPYNDEMEAKAFHEAGLSTTPVNSLKGYFGHTLGAAGIVESVISILSLQTDTTIPSAGYMQPGVTPELNIMTEPIHKKLKHCLKTASGFGGCNAAIIFSKN